MKLVTVKTYAFPHEAQVDRGKLESEGIPVYLKDEIFTQVTSYTQAVGGVKLQVNEKDAPKALELLRNEEIIDISDAFKNVKCPHCASNDVSRTKTNFFLALIGTTKYQCSNCHKTFNA